MKPYTRVTKPNKLRKSGRKTLWLENISRGVPVFY